MDNNEDAVIYDEHTVIQDMTIPISFAFSQYNYSNIAKQKKSLPTYYIPVYSSIMINLY